MLVFACYRKVKFWWAYLARTTGVERCLRTPCSQDHWATSGLIWTGIRAQWKIRHRSTVCQNPSLTTTLIWVGMQPPAPPPQQQQLQQQQQQLLLLLLLLLLLHRDYAKFFHNHSHCFQSYNHCFPFIDLWCAATRRIKDCLLLLQSSCDVLWPNMWHWYI